MVALDALGKPVDIVIKQRDRGLRYSWSIAAWSPAFSRYLGHSMDAVAASIEADATAREPSVGDVIQNAIRDGMAVEAVRFDTGGYVDVGSPRGLESARQRFR